MTEVTLSTPTDRVVVVERFFDAPREQVFDIFTNPDIIPQWWGNETVVEAMDFRDGGEYRWKAKAPNGWEAVATGVYSEIAPPARFSQTFEMGGRPAHTQLHEFEDLGERTRLVITMTFDTAQEAQVVQSGPARQGMNWSYGRIDDLLAARV